MMRFATSGLIMSLAIGGILIAEEKAGTTPEGTYQVISIEKDGKPAPRQKDETVTVTFKAGMMTVNLAPGVEKTAKVTMDSSKMPPTIDIAPQDGPEKGKTFPGIYKIDKGELIVVFSEKAADRPTAFSSEGGKMMLKLKKEVKK